jgi:hypothetical protein
MSLPLVKFNKPTEPERSALTIEEVMQIWALGKNSSYTLTIPVPNAWAALYSDQGTLQRNLTTYSDVSVLITSNLIALFLREDPDL